MLNEEKLQNHARNIRKQIIQQGYLSGRGHISSALSCVEILTLLYCTDIVDKALISERSINRDRIILSKAHAGLSLYAALIESGLCNEDILEGFCTSEGLLATHPRIGICKGLESTGGSLGQGLNFACGIAYAQKIAGLESNIYVLVGDGEMQEGCVWEALLFCNRYQLNNLTIFIDNNGRQISGRTADIISICPIVEKIKSFNLDVFRVNGHDFQQLHEAVERQTNNTKVIVADTIKGKGISFMEDCPGWHGKGLTREQYEVAMKEISND